MRTGIHGACHRARIRATRWLENALTTMDELAMDFATRRIDHGYFKVLIVAQTTVAEVSCEDAAMCNRVRFGLEADSDSVSKGNAVFHIEKEFLHRILPLIQGQSSTRRIFYQTASRIFA